MIYDHNYTENCKKIDDHSVRNSPFCEQFAECGREILSLFPFYKLPNVIEIRLPKKIILSNYSNQKLNHIQENLIIYL